MVEVFKTNVINRDLADALIDHIHKNFNDYEANFDLEDCDKVLVVRCPTGEIQVSALIIFLENFGCNAEVLPG